MSVADEKTEQVADAARNDSQVPSEMYLAFLRADRRRRLMIIACQITLLVLFLLLWEIAPRAHWVNPMLTSTPSGVWNALFEGVGEQSLAYHTWITLQETIVGFAISMILGIGVAVALWWWEFLYRVLDPFMVVANALPKIALAPIFYIWLGDVASIYANAIAIAVFITILMVYAGFRETNPNKLKLLQTFGANRRQMLQKVVLPGNIPTIIAAIKINIGLALVGVIVGEFQASKAGLGYLIVYGSQIFKMDLVMCAIAILAVISTIMYLVIHQVEATILKRRQ